jgi:hypothetical protein
LVCAHNRRTFATSKVNNGTQEHPKDKTIDTSQSIGTKQSKITNIIYNQQFKKNDYDNKEEFG